MDKIYKQIVKNAPSSIGNVKHYLTFFEVPEKYHPKEKLKPIKPKNELGLHMAQLRTYHNLKERLEE